MAFENLKSTGIKYLLGKLKTVFLQIKDAVKTVNGEEADEDGNITINSVPFAQNLESESSQRNYDSFIIRTSGGEGSIDNGDAWLMNIKGNSVHDDFVPESLEMTVSAIERENPITATINRNTFVAYVADSGTTTLIYSSEWTEDPALYGITVTGTPVNGDIITVVYVKEVRGTITVATPSAFNATGWNLYNATLGYARVVKYSHGYKISGNYSALQYSATVSGEKTTIQVVDGNFDIPSDGYVWVTGGGSNTAIWLTWTDWTESANNGEYEGHTESSVDLSSVMSTYFPNGLMKVGNTSDEIDLNLGQVHIRVDRMEYNAENLATAKASGREYDYDENYIYLAKATETTQSITIDGSFTTSDHGIDYFASTEVEVETQILYGDNLKNKLERDVLTISQQSLTAAQQTQVRNNINAEKKGIGTSKTVNFNGLHSATTGVTSGLDTLLDAELATMAAGDRRAFNLVPAGDATFIGNAIPFNKGRNNYGVLTKNTNTYASYIGTDVSYGNLIVGARSSGGWAFRGFGLIVDITSKCTGFEGGSVPGNTKVLYFNSSIIINYQGVGSTHNANDVLFTLPTGFRPSYNTYIPFIQNNASYGIVQIGTNGVVAVNQISSTSASGRIYFHCVIPISGL